MLKGDSETRENPWINKRSYPLKHFKSISKSNLINKAQYRKSHSFFKIFCKKIMSILLSSELTFIKNKTWGVDTAQYKTKKRTKPV